MNMTSSISTSTDKSRNMNFSYPSQDTILTTHKNWPEKYKDYDKGKYLHFRLKTNRQKNNSKYNKNQFIQSL